MGEVANECTWHKSSLFAIFLPKLSKLVEIWWSYDKNKFAGFFRHGVYTSTVVTGMWFCVGKYFYVNIRQLSPLLLACTEVCTLPSLLAPSVFAIWKMKNYWVVCSNLTLYLYNSLTEKAQAAQHWKSETQTAKLDETKTRCITFKSNCTASTRFLPRDAMLARY